MKNFTLLFFMLCFILVISACQTPLIQPHKQGEYVSISPKAWIEVKNKVSVEADSARAFFQLGELIHSSRLNLYEVNCELEVRDVLDTEQTISPDRFKIIKAQQDQSPIVFFPNQKIHYAINREEGPSDIKRFWKFTLQSQQQPNVMHLICRGVQDFPANAELPTVEEMQQALGSLVDIHLL